MKIIRHGEVIQFVCPVCGCEFLMREEETYQKPDSEKKIEEEKYFAVCPDCGEADVPGEKKDFSPVVETETEKTEEQKDEEVTEPEARANGMVDYMAVVDPQK